MLGGQEFLNYVQEKHWEPLKAKIAFLLEDCIVRVAFCNDILKQKV